MRHALSARSAHPAPIADSTGIDAVQVDQRTDQGGERQNDERCHGSSPPTASFL
jgi:hypothetical protein